MSIARWSPSNRRSCRCPPPQLTALPIKIPIQMVMQPPVKIVISLRNRSDLWQTFKCKTLKNYLRNEWPVNSGNTHYISNMYIGEPARKEYVYALLQESKETCLVWTNCFLNTQTTFIVVRCLCKTTLAVRECIRDYFKESISTRNRCYKRSDVSRFLRLRFTWHPVHFLPWGRYQYKTVV